jgi:hypothetical protein
MTAICGASTYEAPRSRCSLLGRPRRAVSIGRVHRLQGGLNASSKAHPMNPTAQSGFADLVFELRFDPLVDQQAPLSFPCDARGHVDLDELCDRSRRDYLFAHTLIGRQFTAPVVRACVLNA